METLRAYVEILIFLAKSNSWKTTKEIREFLENLGILRGSYDNNRRKIINYLNNLELAGYILRNESKGKHQEWKIDENSGLREIITLSEREKNALLLSLSFIPQIYKDLKFREDIRSIINKVKLQRSKDFEKIVSNSFLYIPKFIEKSFYDDFTLLEKLIEDILNQRLILINYKNKTRKILPLRILYYEGLMYLSALEFKKDGSQEYKTFRLSCIKRFESGEEVKNILIYQKNALSTFKFSGEKPFPFAIELPSYHLKCEREEVDIKRYLISQTQFEIEIVGKDSIKVYLVGFTSKRFYSNLSQLEIRKLYKPDLSMVRLLKKKLREDRDRYLSTFGRDRFSDLSSISTTESKVRYNEFKEGFRKFLINNLKVLD